MINEHNLTTIAAIVVHPKTTNALNLLCGLIEDARDTISTVIPTTKW